MLFFDYEPFIFSNYLLHEKQLYLMQMIIMCLSSHSNSICKLVHENHAQYFYQQTVDEHIIIVKVIL